MGLPFQQDMGTYIAKYDDRFEADMKRILFTQKMTKCVEIAREMVLKAEKALQARWEEDENDSLDEMLRFHFGDEDNDEIDQILLDMEIIYENTRKGLDGKFRLASVPLNKMQDSATKDEGGRMLGYVSSKPAPKDKEVSEWKTVQVQRKGIDDDILRGSIHVQYGLFDTPPKPVPVDANEKGITGVVHSEVGIAGIILHEATHRWAFTTDEGGYLGTSKYNGARSEVKKKNADCYAALAISIYLGKLVKKDKDIDGYQKIR